jgi:hypothetical protein
MLLAHAAAAQPDAPPEPDGYRMEDYRSSTPATLKGAKVVGTGDAAPKRVGIDGGEGEIRHATGDYSTQGL